jgi:hypothetical protein
VSQPTHPFLLISISISICLQWESFLFLFLFQVHQSVAALTTVRRNLLLQISRADAKSATAVYIVCPRTTYVRITTVRRPIWFCRNNLFVVPASASSIKSRKLPRAGAHPTIIFRDLSIAVAAPKTYLHTSGVAIHTIIFVI